MSNTHNQIPPRFERLSVLQWVLLLSVIVFLLGSFRTTEFAPDRLARGMKRLWEILGEMFPPKMDRLGPLLQQTLLTLQIATLGTVLGVLMSLLVGQWACRHIAPAWVSAILRGWIGVVRTIPELIWGLAFVACFGLGPLAGVLAVAADTLGFCGRFFTEAFDDVPDKDLEGLRAMGSSRLGLFLSLILPNSLPTLVHNSLFALERAVRASIVLGLVGAGGIGVELDVAMRLFRYDEACMILFLILALVLLIERISEEVRQRIRLTSK